MLNFSLLFVLRWTLNLKLIKFFSLFSTMTKLGTVGGLVIEERRIKVINLESEQQQEGHHKTEKSHGFGQGETQDGV